MDGFFLPFSQLFNLSSLFGTLVSSLIFLVVLFLVLRRRRPVEQRTKESAFDQTVDLFPQVPCLCVFEYRFLNIIFLNI